MEIEHESITLISLTNDRLVGFCIVQKGEIWVVNSYHTVSGQTFHHSRSPQGLMSYSDAKNEYERRVAAEIASGYTPVAQQQVEKVPVDQATPDAAASEARSAWSIRGA